MSYGAYIIRDKSIAPVTNITTDPDGRSVVSILLANQTAKAFLYQPDYDRLVAQYGLHSLVVLSNEAGKDTVFLSGPAAGERTDVALFLMGDIAGKVVRYLDGNPLNLRKGNLSLDAA